ncbi:MAG: hypothetical protein IKB06_00920 [Clostridia bacterium]|nr:hypothetical protein [Clostridia bacterium]
MIANEMYAINLPTDETFLSSSKNIMVIATIFQQAITKHMSIYKKKEIPLTFIEFYINEIKNYSYMFRKQVTEFFEMYDKISPNFEIIANVYLRSYYSQAKCLKKKKGELYLIPLPEAPLDHTKDMLSSADKDISSSVSNILKITEHINHSDEIIPFHENYENYMISRIIRKTEFINKYNGKSRLIINIYDNAASPQIISATKRAERLTSERLNISKQRGKVTKIVIPKLKLPTTYPKTVTFNRFNSKLIARNFVSASRQILILNDLKINGVAYSNNFVDKRLAMNEA